MGEDASRKRWTDPKMAVDRAQDTASKRQHERRLFGAFTVTVAFGLEDVLVAVMRRQYGSNGAPVCIARRWEKACIVPTHLIEEHQAYSVQV